MLLKGNFLTISIVVHSGENYTDIYKNFIQFYKI